jgi:hypothetical protein
MVERKKTTLNLKKARVAARRLAGEIKSERLELFVRG